ncbi:MAG TPA: hypothetical protein DCR77_05230 [Flavobacteriaceae bacterium]|uniref:hypothetical protein n=1 Tax=Empedobacter sp. GD03865 TaxID=2975392 RepID=UPI000E8D73FE|nr:hypothetical protein [Empedobacter sp. GD03865]MDH0658313.1 hypothetical protein [Empedobacter sp. GD03865]HAR72794.1 hypothetical protein [Flavobacteriaceae bacterium]
MKNIFLLFFFIIFSCSKIDEVKDNTIQKVKNKASTTTEVVWKKSVDKLFQNTTAINSIKLGEVYDKGLIFEIKNQKGVKIDFLGGFYQCFFKYQSDKNDLFKFLNDLKTDKADISDNELMKTNEVTILEKINFIKSKFPEIYNKLDFFTEFNNIGELEYYQIAKYPHYNILIYDKSNNTFYHFVENYQD